MIPEYCTTTAVSSSSTVQAATLRCCDHAEENDAGVDDVPADRVGNRPERIVHADRRVLLEHAGQQVVRPAQDVEEVAEEDRAAEIFGQGQRGQQRAEQQGGPDDVHREGGDDANRTVHDEVAQVEPHAAAGDEEAAQLEERRHQHVAEEPEERYFIGINVPGNRRRVPGDDQQSKSDTKEIKTGAPALMPIYDFIERNHSEPFRFNSILPWAPGTRDGSAKVSLLSKTLST